MHSRLDWEKFYFNCAKLSISLISRFASNQEQGFTNRDRFWIWWADSFSQKIFNPIFTKSLPFEFGKQNR